MRVRCPLNPGILWTGEGSNPTEFCAFRAKGLAKVSPKRLRGRAGSCGQNARRSALSAITAASAEEQIRIRCRYVMETACQAQKRTIAEHASPVKRYGFTRLFPLPLGRRDDATSLLVCFRFCKNAWKVQMRRDCGQLNALSPLSKCTVTVIVAVYCQGNWMLR
jgi:hypothetical protein